MRQQQLIQTLFTILSISCFFGNSACLAEEDKVEGALPNSWSKKIEWRSIGPANMMGRITALAVYEKDTNIWYAASASGGLLKTTNNGTTFEHQFDQERTVSIGDVQVSKTDPDLVWVGTGESNPRNSVSWGDGVYKSTDGGKTWNNMGLKKIFQTGRIAIHPEDHDTVYVGALGRLWGPNEERGLFKTTDGGKKWEKIFYVDDKTGVIDVQMNPQNPDELLIATYERMRDGFDGNDPVKKYGEGSAIYKSVDAGKTFTRISQGLPSCKLGRIGLTYFFKDPNIVAAIIESEKIAQQPKDAAYAGIRGESAEVGAKITQVTDEGPAQKAGLKENDIVVSIDGEIVYSYDDLLKGIRKRKSGETAKLVVSRDRKPVDIAIELGERPAPRNSNSRRNRNRTRRTPFTGTLGGQAANLQGQQGDNESEYGGIYLSKDGGDSWERINTLNPRPMYYSQIRIDPQDLNNMYVLGTSLYRSKDGGKTFTGDGGRGIHVDHHALWIDPDDPRHMILGNDGGIYVTHNRMDNWDHHNHAAIGQFYHVGINSRLDYHVYGGLQDNGSWGGPARVSNDSGPVNTDWYRVGGGDGFITLADPDDPDQIYFESQNGAMGRIHLKTGERGFIRPRPPRGTRYRFNWKTPFTLSPHNSKIHYSAGNYVFRSFNKGSGVKAISPEITNTDKGAGSAISESPVQAGVLYVGTTDGAVWMTKDGGNEWVPLYHKKGKPDEKKSEEDNSEKKEKNAKANESNAPVVEKDSKGNSDSDSEKAPNSVAAKKNDLNGTWEGRMISDRFPEGQAPQITLTLSVDKDGKVTGEVETRRGKQDITSGEFNSESGELNFLIATDRGRREFEATVTGSTMTGEMSMRNGQFQIDFEAEKQADPDKETIPSTTPMLAAAPLLTAIIFKDDSPSDDDPISGTWNGVVRAEQIPDGEIKFTIELEMDSKNMITGMLEAPQGSFEIEEGEYNPETKKIYFSGENEQVFIDVEAVLTDGKMKGDIVINDQITAEFEANVRELKSKQLEESESPGEETEDPKVEEAEKAQEMQKPNTETPRRQRAFLGVQFARRDNSPEGNLPKIEMIVPDSAADKAKLQPGDVITAIDGTSFVSMNPLIQYLRSKFAGDEIQMKLKRGDQDVETTVTLGSITERPNQQSLGQRRESTPPVNTPESSDDKKDKEGQSELGKSTDDKISGTWTGKTVSQRGDRDITFTLKQKSPKEITGAYETAMGERDITEGSYNNESKVMTLVSDTDQFTIEFSGTVDGDNWSGELDFNSGAFTAEFEVKRTEAATSSPETDEAQEAKAKGKSLEELLPGPRWVSSIHASKFKAERCYISFDGHRSNDDMPHVFVTEDFGKSWESIQANLPDWAGSVRVVREDLKNENVIYLGCEFGAWVSIDRGQSWTRFANMPTVSVHEFAQHPVLDDIVAATHGRSLWVCDVSALRQIKKEDIGTPHQLYDPKPVILWKSNPRRGSSGTRKFVGANPDSNAKIAYSLGSNARFLEIQIKNMQGETLKRFEDAPTDKGLHVMDWDLRRAGNSNRGRFGPRIAAGQYLVEMRANGESLQSILEVKNDPNAPFSNRLATESESSWWLEFGTSDDN